MDRFAALVRLDARALAARLAEAAERGDADPLRLVAQDDPGRGVFGRGDDDDDDDDDDAFGGGGGWDVGLPADGSGWLWHGLSLGLPSPLARVFGKFGKTFVIDEQQGGIRGWNTRMRQSRDAAWEPARVGGREVTYGHYRLTEAGPDAPYPGALLIDYGGGANKPWDPLGLVRDYIAEVEPDLWLGHMFLEVALPGPLARFAPPRLVATPSWFALARGKAITRT